MNDLFTRFVILGYGRNYTTLLASGYPPGSVRFSAIMQYSFILWMNVFSLVHISLSFIPDTYYAISGTKVKQIVRAVDVGVIILMPFFVAYLTKNYRDDYNAISEEGARIKFFVGIYPYVVCILFFISFLV
ncbi:MAG: hypothetical protein VB954_01575 [Thalassolituus sp.]|uniref:hypothetical protein n=1 Tax=Thalassolituus sp. TaxID=2030822 RepID=UPI003982912D|tara:strand:+ start:3491 stop:3883 length:393 start_codon:yes stop_codon:yes gene_type:complete